MVQHHGTIRKIDPAQGELLGDQTPNDNNRVEIGPTQLAFKEWEAAGLVLPNLPQMREYRWKRLTQHIVDRDYGGLLMFDPLNIRYATDSTNMQLWNGKYGALMHGVGLCDEWPLIAYPDQLVEGAYDYDLETGMVLCVEALVSPEGGDFSIKLEDQVLITEDGYENLTKFPFDVKLMG